jgi:hypothetical protein
LFDLTDRKTCGRELISNNLAVWHLYTQQHLPTKENNFDLGSGIRRGSKVVSLPLTDA